MAPSFKSEILNWKLAIKFKIKNLFYNKKVFFVNKSLELKLHWILEKERNMKKKTKILFISTLSLAFTTASFLMSCKTEISNAKKNLIAKINELEALKSRHESVSSLIEEKLKYANNILNNFEARDSDFLTLINDLDDFMKKIVNGQNKQNEKQDFIPNQKESNQTPDDSKVKKDDNKLNQPEDQNLEKQIQSNPNDVKFEKHEDHIERNTNLEKADISAPYYSIKDEYLMSYNNQANFNLCWAFSSTKALETTLMKHQNELYKISEAGLDMQRYQYSEKVGAGGRFIETTWALLGRAYNSDGSRKKLESVNGFLLENDFPTHALYHINENRKVYYEKFLKSRYITNSHYLVKQKRYIANEIEQIKKHLKTQGSLDVGVGNFGWLQHNTHTQKINEQKQTKIEKKISDITKMSLGVPVKYDHAVAIIGWDDNYTVTGTNKKGAWIIMNSWNNDIWYLSYDFYKHMNTDYAIHGFVYRKPKVLISHSDQKITITDAGAADSANNFQYHTKESKTTNVFEYKKGVDIKYSVNKEIANNFLKMNIKIYNQGKDITEQFEINGDGNQTTYQVKSKSKDIAHGSYRVVLEYEYIDKETQKTVSFTENRQLFVWTGAGRVLQSTSYDIYSNSKKNYPLTKRFYSFAHTDEEFTVYNIAGYRSWINYSYGPETKAHYFKIEGENGTSEINANGFTKYLKELSENEGEKLYTLKVYDQANNVLEENKLRMFMLKDGYGTNLFSLLTITNGNNTKYKNQYINRPFNSESNSKFFKYELETLDDPKFIKYVYYDKNGNKKDLPKDTKTNKYYIDYKLVAENKHEAKNDYQTDNNIDYYQYSLLIIPEFK